MTISFITYSAEPEISSDDIPLAQELERRGIKCQSRPWDGAEEVRDAASSYLIRSPWNYDGNPEAFVRRLEDLERRGSKIINSLQVVRWNISKRYLLEVEKCGLRIPRTRFFIPDQVESQKLIDDFPGMGTFVVKPCTSLSAHNTFLVGRTDLPERIGALQNPHREYLIQEYLPEIAEGELSFVFFGGSYSHCIAKIPKRGEFRVQADHGARRERYQPSVSQIDEASAFLGTVPEVPTYARIDVVIRNEKLILMEIEAIDPVLFLSWEPESSAKFADAILGALKNIQGG